MKTLNIKSFLLGVFTLCSFGIMANGNDAVVDKASNENTAFSTVDELPSCIGIDGANELPLNMMGYYMASFEGGIPAGAYIDWVVQPSGNVYFNPSDGIGNPIGIRFTEPGTYQVSARLKTSGKTGKSTYVYVTVK